MASTQAALQATQEVWAWQPMKIVHARLLAGRSRGSLGWFDGLMRHLVVNDEGELHNC
jgi:hypothetical protein